MKPDNNTEKYFSDIYKPASQNRRDFLKKLGGGIIVVFCIGELSLLQSCGKDLLNFNAYIRVKENGRVDCYTGKIISVKQRTSDIIEMIHDGSIIDYLFKSSSENAKLVYSTLTSLGLILLAFSGFFMWLRSKQIKRHKRKIH
jgi:hypothetical protein